MVVALGVWSLVVSPGDPLVITPPADLRITNVALGDEIEDKSSRTTVKLVYRSPGVSGDSEDEGEEDEDDEDDEDADNVSGRDQFSTTVLCSLTLGQIEQATVDVVLNEDEEYLIELVGNNSVHLTGNYIDQRPADFNPFSDGESEEEDFDIDSEMDPEEMALLKDDRERFQEIVEETPPKASNKRPRESDVIDTSGKLSKEQKKQKKLKNANGEAVEVPSPEQSEQEEAQAKDVKDKKNQSEKKDKTEKGKGKAEVKTIDGGVQVIDSKVGTGRKAKAGNTVSLRYIGKLKDGKIFDKNTKGEPFKFRLGRGEVIKGWDAGIAGMQVGGERILTIPPGMAYGKKGDKVIPANSTLTFEVKLLAIKS